LDEAIESFQRALALQPGVAEIHQNLARALAMQGKKAEAAEHLEAALRILKSPQQSSAEGFR
jgi:tetratricopeptide (TPR) repeat protein